MSGITSYLPHDLQSLLPRGDQPPTAQIPSIGSQAPSFPNVSYNAKKKGTLIAFVRHCGCPFAEKEVKLLGQVAKEDKEGEVQIVVVQHSEEGETKQWWKRIGGADLLPNAHLISDPKREIYASFGIGTLGWSGLFSRSMITNLLNLKNNEGIVNTTTGAGSWRWGNSGGLAVDDGGIVKWVKVAEDAGDVCNYVEAGKTLQ